MDLMNIVGCNVMHKSVSKNFGKGTICEASEKMVAVSFPDKVEGNKIVKFVFPEAFKKELLVPADALAKDLIQEAISSLKCSICALENVQTEKIDGKRLCAICKSKYTSTCSSCGDYHLNGTLITAWAKGRYQKSSFCKTCSDLKTFTCRHCNSRYVNELRSTFDIDGMELCYDCFDEVKKVCTFCNKPFDIDDGDYFDSYDGWVYVCPDCLDAQTFICKSCEERKLNTSRVNSKYVPADRQICDWCASNCSICEVEIYDEDVHSAFGKDYCPECWAAHKKKCIRCGLAFVSLDAEHKYCPDCVDMNQYVERLKKENFVDRTYKTIKYSSLESIDRCKVFTELYAFSQSMTGRQMYLKGFGEPFQMLVMDFTFYKAVIAYVPSEIIGKAKHSLNITMTDFRKRAGRSKVHNAIRGWLVGSHTHIDTSAGRMTVLDYPVLLRVQTDFDKNYGKEWNGPGDYIEIGNYGDTTNFYIIGVLDET